MKRIFIVAVIITFIDQIIKNALFFNFSLNESLTVIDNFFNITLLGNTGAAFSILLANTSLLIAVSVIAIILIYWFFIKNQVLDKKSQYIYGILFGGIIGNLIDRLFRGYVIDYLDFTIFGYSFPVFNLADICITISIVLLIFYIYKGEKNENRS
ncbi:MAG: signal peptidase II [Bacilli bacterium]|nr:signal peptidase II [Bacilli bacterium]